MTPEDLVEIEEIKQAKYRYVRAVDTRDWKLLSSVLTDDATAAYSAGKLSFDGSEAIIEFLRSSLPPGEFLTAHRVQQPEITLTGPTTAEARWALDDVVIAVAASLTVRGAGIYEDRMVKVAGEWKIEHTGYRRLYEEMEKRDGVTLTDHWWASGLGHEAAEAAPIEK
jgi:hypothetical protein